ncbi:MAG: heavy metal translocating P-type ATPase [Burkholderiales bacterium]
MSQGVAAVPLGRDAAVEAAACFHCGLPIQGPPFAAVVDGIARDTCCRGCQAVAQTIADSGLSSYYRNRSALPAVPELDPAQDLAVYDLAAVQRTFVHELDPAGHQKEAALLLDGITCAACMWLIERRAAAVPGVTGVAANYATRRLRLRWDGRQTKLSAVLKAVRELGYGAEPYDSTRSDDALRKERKTLLWRVFVSGFAMMQVMMYAVPAYLDDSTLTADIDALLRIASLALTLPVVAWAALPFYAGAWRQIRAGQVGMDVPISAGIAISFFASLYATATGAGAVYFDSIAMFVFLLLGARYLELSARTRAAAAQDRLVRLAPAVAEKLDHFPGGSELRQVAAAMLCPGDFALVRPGALVPADGVVVEGRSSVDESLITGESRAVPKAAGDPLIGGARNKQDALVMRVKRAGTDTVLSGIVQLMDRAQSERPRTAEMADRAARIFVAALLVVSVIAGAAWYAVDPGRALWIVIAVLVVSCPCALSLATPVALTAATGALYGQGVLVTRGHALETLAKATHYVFDKTGTLTTATMALIGVIPLGGRRREDCLAYAAGLEARSEHPIARAIVEAAEGRAPRAVSDVRSVEGQGLEGVLDGVRVRIGTPEFVASLNGLPPPPELVFVSEEASVVALGDEREWIALLTFGETLRADARRVVKELKASGRQVCLLSGDRQARVDRVARELGIDIAHGDATPAAKVEFVRALQAGGAVVAMIGDGVNDAPVLAQAQVSFALRGATQLAQLSSDIVLMSERLGLVQHARLTAERARRVIRENIAWAVAYNACALPLAVLGHVTPVVAAAGMSLSSLAVVLNAMRLIRPPQASAATPTKRFGVLGRA